MKDFRLSEMVEECKKHDKCCDCRIKEFCGAVSFEGLKGLTEKISPRDMIELPCKMEYEGQYGKCWKVYYRNVLDGTIDNQGFYDETQAGAFLQELKNGKV